MLSLVSFAGMTLEKVHRPSDRDVNWMVSVQVKEPNGNLNRYGYL